MSSNFWIQQGLCRLAWRFLISMARLHLLKRMQASSKISARPPLRAAIRMILPVLKETSTIECQQSTKFSWQFFFNLLPLLDVDGGAGVWSSAISEIFGGMRNATCKELWAQKTKDFFVKCQPESEGLRRNEHQQLHLFLLVYVILIQNTFYVPDMKENRAPLHQNQLQVYHYSQQ